MGGSVRSVSKRGTPTIISAKFVGFNVGMFVTFGVGYLLLLFSLAFVASGGGSGTATTAGSSGFGGGFLFAGSIVFAFAMAMFLAPFIALVNGVFTTLGTKGTLNGVLTATIGSALGFTLLAVVVTVLGSLLLPSGAGGLGSALVPIVAIAVATGLTGGLSAAVTNAVK